MHASALGTEELAERIRKIEGQVRGVGHMVAEGAGALELLTQLAAARGAIDAVAAAVAEREMRRYATSETSEAEVAALISRVVHW